MADAFMRRAHAPTIWTPRRPGVRRRSGRTTISAPPSELVRMSAQRSDRNGPAHFSVNERPRWLAGDFRYLLEGMEAPGRDRINVSNVLS